MSNRGKLQMPPKLTMQGSQKSFAFGTLGKSARGLLNRRAADDELRRKDDADKLEQEKQEQLQQGAELEQKELSGTTVQELAQRLDTNIEKGTHKQRQRQRWLLVIVMVMVIVQA